MNNYTFVKCLFRLQAAHTNEIKNSNSVGSSNQNVFQSLESGPVSRPTRIIKALIPIKGSICQFSLSWLWYTELRNCWSCQTAYILGAVICSNVAVGTTWWIENLGGIWVGVITNTFRLGCLHVRVYQNYSWYCDVAKDGAEQSLVGWTCVPLITEKVHKWWRSSQRSDRRTDGSRRLKCNGGCRASI